MPSLQQDRNTMLDISSDITVFGVILAVAQVCVYHRFGPNQALVLIGFLGAAAIWKLLSPFSETATSWSRYLQAVLLIVSGVLISIIMLVL